MRVAAILLLALALSLSIAAQTVDPANHIWLLDGTTASSPSGGGGGLSNVVEDTTPQLGGQLDQNGFCIGDDTTEKILCFTEVSGSVNYIEMNPQIAGQDPTLKVVGDDPNIDFKIEAKGIGRLTLDDFQFLNDSNSRISATGDVITFTPGGTIGFTLTEVANVSTGEFFAPFIRDTLSGITANVTQTQGQNPITSEVVEVSTVANVGDVCGTLPAAVGGKRIIIINNGLNECQIFPASGDNLSSGVDLAMDLPHEHIAVLVAYDSTNWASEGESVTPHAVMLDEDNTDVFVVNDSGSDFHSYHTNALALGESVGWTFDAGGGGTSFPIASVADSAGSPGSQILVTTTGSHGLAVDDIISQTNLADAAYVGIFEVVATAAATTYEVAAVFTATGTGTMDQAATIECSTELTDDYHITWHATATSATNNETFDFAIYKGATTVPGTKVRRKFGTASDFGAFTGGGIVHVDCGDKISLALANNDSAGNLTIRHLTIVAEKL